MDIAYTILVYGNTKDVWEEDLQIKASSKDDMERYHAMHHKNPSIMKEGDSISKGSAMVGHMMGKKILGIFKDPKSSNVWETLQEYYKLYLRKHYARGHNQDDDLRTPEEECTARDKDDWQIDMPDGDEIDYIKEASVDDDSPCPRTRPRLSC